ncbi:low-affinity methionine permease [[Candida] railenensis]|uniref:Low-affinity methionine permease n=1 Tax=[Candida] railenensis TaxID=45579 RepID=A0A9P0QVV8_9ASCO|nr:low-affinity methionine permease [[Candida] railenensis]
MNLPFVTSDPQSEPEEGQSAPNIPLENIMSKKGYTKLNQVDVIESSTASEESSYLIQENEREEEYNRPSLELHGNVSYLQTLEELPQGRHLGIFSTIVLFIGRIVGSGIFATPASIYQDVGGSPFLFFLAWILAAVVAFSGLYVYLELGSLIPRSGGTKVFLEFIYTKPKYLASIVFSIYSVMFGFTLSNALVFGEYFLHSIGVEPTEYRTRLIGLGIIYATVIIHGVSVHHGVKIQNIIGAMKLALMGIMTLTGIYSVCFPSSVTGIESNLKFDKSFFESSQPFSSSLFASAIIKASFSYNGWGSVHTVSSEIKDPVRTFKIAGPVSLGLVTISYVFTNLAYLVVIPGDEISNSGKLVGSLLFEKVLGEKLGRNFLSFAISISSASNVLVVIYTISRVSQEVFREGFLPCSEFMASNWPWGSPLPTLILSALLSTACILLPPKGDIYNYLIALEGYPVQIYTALVTVGVYIIRRRHPELRAPIRSSIVGTSLLLIITLYLMVSPLTSKVSPNPKGLENWPSYPWLALFCLSLCVGYWLIMFVAKPRFFGYQLVAEEKVLDDGLIIKQWKKLYNISEL